MPRKFNSDTYERIITERLIFGKSSKVIAEEIGAGRSSVDAIVYGFQAVKAGDWDKVCSMIKGNSCAFGYIQWAAKKCGVELPEAVIQAQENRYKPEQEEKPAPPPPAPAAPDHWEEEKLLLQTLIGAVKQQNELLEQLYDVVLPKWVGDIKDNVNINSDQQTQALKRIEGLVEAVKINTRRRGT